MINNLATHLKLPVKYYVTISPRDARSARAVLLP